MTATKTTTLPAWVTPQTFCRCGSTIFEVAAVKRSSLGTLHLSDGQDLHLLASCKQATLADLARCDTLVIGGLPMGLRQTGDQVTLTHGPHRRVVRIEGGSFAEAAANFAQAFDGVVIEDWEGESDAA